MANKAAIYFQSVEKLLYVFKNKKGLSQIDFLKILTVIITPKTLASYNGMQVFFVYVVNCRYWYHYDSTLHINIYVQHTEEAGCKYASDRECF